MGRPRKISASFTRVRRAERRLYYWLRENHDDFAAELARTRPRDRWSQAMAVITEHQLLDARGNPPTKDTAADTWKRVCTEIAADRARKQAAAEGGPTLQPDEIAPGVRAVPTGWTRSIESASSPAAPTQPPRPVQAASPPRLESAGSVRTALVGEEQDSNSSDRMQNLLDAMRAGKVPLPKTI